jgi:hypothetical protein
LIWFWPYGKKSVGPKWISELMMKVFERYGLKDKIKILYSKLGEDPINRQNHLTPQAKPLINW